MRKMLLLAVTGLAFDLSVDPAKAGGIRERDVATQREMATGRASPDASGRPARPPDSKPADSNIGLAPGFVTPFGYPLPPYADGNNFQTIYTGR